LLAAAQARLELLAVAPEARQRGVGRGLAGLAAARARRRGCGSLRCGGAAATDLARDFLRRTGWQPAGEEYMFDLGNRAQ
jgi:GNAT superfamily N-acetyltransferase